MKNYRLKTTSILNNSFLIITFFFSSITHAQENQSYVYTPAAEFSQKFSKDRNISELNYMQPFLSSENKLPILDVKLKLDNKKSKEANLGLAYRYNYEDRAIFGTYIYFDHRNTRNNFSVNGLTYGAEVLSKYIDARANIYVPQNKRKKIAHNSNKTVEVHGNSIFAISGGHTYENSLKGYDIEIGGPLFFFSKDLNKKLATKIHMASYSFNTKNIKAFTGTRFRLQQDIAKLWLDNNSYNFHLGAETQYDKIRKRQNFIGLGLKINFNDKQNQGYKNENSLNHRMMETIIRDVDIVTKQHSEDQAQHIFHLDGKRLGSIYYVGNAKSGYIGTGTINNPLSIEQFNSGNYENAFIVLTAIDPKDGGIPISFEDYDKINSMPQVLNDTDQMILHTSPTDQVSISVHGIDGISICSTDENTKLKHNTLDHDEIKLLPADKMLKPTYTKIQNTSYVQQTPLFIAAPRLFTTAAAPRALPPLETPALQEPIPFILNAVGTEAEAAGEPLILHEELVVAPRLFTTAAAPKALPPLETPVLQEPIPFILNAVGTEAEAAGVPLILQEELVVAPRLFTTAREVTVLPPLETPVLQEPILLEEVLPESRRLLTLEPILEDSNPLQAAIIEEKVKEVTLLPKELLSDIKQSNIANLKPTQPILQGDSETQTYEASKVETQGHELSSTRAAITLQSIFRGNKTRAELAKNKNQLILRELARSGYETITSVSPILEIAQIQEANPTDFAGFVLQPAQINKEQDVQDANPAQLARNSLNHVAYTKNPILNEENEFQRLRLKSIPDEEKPTAEESNPAQLARNSLNHVSYTKNPILNEENEFQRLRLRSIPYEEEPTAEEANPAQLARNSLNHVAYTKNPILNEENEFQRLRLRSIPDEEEPTAEEANPAQLARNSLNHVSYTKNPILNEENEFQRLRLRSITDEEEPIQEKTLHEFQNIILHPVLNDEKVTTEEINPILLARNFLKPTPEPDHQDNAVEDEELQEAIRQLGRKNHVPTATERKLRDFIEN